VEQICDLKGQRSRSLGNKKNIKPFITHIFVKSESIYVKLRPSFAGQLTADDRNRIGAISRKALRRGVSCTEFDIDDLIDTVDHKLFAHITDPNHCLHHLLPPTAHHSYSLRKRQHGYQLPHIEYNLHKNSFVNRCLFNLRWLLFSLHHIPHSGLYSTIPSTQLKLVSSFLYTELFYVSYVVDVLQWLLFTVLLLCARYFVVLIRTWTVCSHFMLGLTFLRFM